MVLMFRKHEPVYSCVLCIFLPPYLRIMTIRVAMILFLFKKKRIGYFVLFRYVN